MSVASGHWNLYEKVIVIYNKAVYTSLFIKFVVEQIANNKIAIY